MNDEIEFDDLANPSIRRVIVIRTSSERSIFQYSTDEVSPSLSVLIRISAMD